MKKMKSKLAILIAVSLLASLLSACSTATSAVQLPKVTLPMPTDIVVSGSDGEKITHPSDYDELFEVLSSIITTNIDKGVRSVGGSEDMLAGSAETASATPQEAPAADGEEQGAVSVDYSGTNVQVEGIDEGDIVKTDGSYIYVLHENELIIFKADGANTAQVSRTKVASEQTADEKTFSESKYPYEMYVSGTNVIILFNYYSYESYERTTGEWYYDSEERTDIDIYNVSDPASPVLEHSLGQDGNILASRLLDGKIYLVTTYYVYSDIIVGEPRGYVPCLYVEGEAALVDYRDISILPAPESESYTVLSVFDVDSGTIGENQTVLGGGSTVYMNADSLFLARSVYEDGAGTPYKDSVYTVVEYNSYTSTEITKFDLSNGGINMTATGSVKGNLVDQFAMDEKDGYLRVVTTANTDSYKVYTDEAHGWSNYEWAESKMSNSLYVLDGGMNITGSIEDLAPDERVYSVRFDGDVGYFVTFRNVDPLFAVDLSNPSAPKITSSLKIPGFSEYLHVYGEGLLFGLGLDANEETGRTNGMKLTMFDTSNPMNVTEKHTLLLDMDWSEGLYNHKAILISTGKNIIAFPADNSYYIYAYSADTGFYQKAVVTVQDWSYNSRGLYIGEYAYVVSNAAVTVLDMTAFGVVKTINIAA